MNETLIAQDFIKNQTSSIINSIWPIIKDQLAPLKGPIEVLLIILAVYILFKIIRGFIVLSDHRRLVRLENKMDIVLERLNKTEKHPSKKAKKKDEE